VHIHQGPGQRKSSGCVLKVSLRRRLTWGDLHRCLGFETGGIARFHSAMQGSAEGILGGREATEGPNGMEWQVGAESYG